MINLLNSINTWASNFAASSTPKVGDICTIYFGRIGHRDVRCENTIQYYFWHNIPPIIGVIVYFLGLIVFAFFLYKLLKFLYIILKNNKAERYRFLIIVLLISIPFIFIWLSIPKF
jgi:hypothetical protein